MIVLLRTLALNRRFWDIESRDRIISLADHEKPISSIVFCNDYEYLVSSTEEDMIIWRLECTEQEEVEDEYEDNGDNYKTPKMKYVLKAEYLYF